MSYKAASFNSRGSALSVHGIRWYELRGPIGL